MLKSSQERGGLVYIQGLQAASWRNPKILAVNSKCTCPLPRGDWLKTEGPSGSTEGSGRRTEVDSWFRVPTAPERGWFLPPPHVHPAGTPLQMQEVSRTAVRCWGSSASSGRQDCPGQLQAGLRPGPETLLQAPCTQATGVRPSGTEEAPPGSRCASLPGHAAVSPGGCELEQH